MKYYVKNDTVRVITDSGEGTEFTLETPEYASHNKLEYVFDRPDESYSRVGDRLGLTLLLGLHTTSQYMTAVADDIEDTGFGVRDAVEAIWKEMGE